ncbi:hypothetical protein [Knoellia sp. LjRoot47]|uniref:hypothetical protein n=1 Tax=Knoellia sp. LjRoot47 TaxID=3342330 RepID=UPI003ECDB614
MTSDAGTDAHHDDAHDEVRDDRVGRRAELLPEEQAVGSDDPEAQARAILAESQERTEHPESTRHDSTQTPDPDEP